MIVFNFEQHSKLLSFTQGHQSGLNTGGVVRSK